MPYLLQGHSQQWKASGPLPEESLAFSCHGERPAQAWLGGHANRAAELSGGSLQAPQVGLAASATSLLRGAFLGGRWVAGGWREELYTPVLPGFGASPTGSTLQLGNLGRSLNFQGLIFLVQELGGRAPALLGVGSAQ